MKYNPETALAESIQTAVSAGHTREWAEHVATFDPFAGDFGDGSERTLDDRLVIAKRAGPCRGFDGPCSRGVRKGEVARVIKKVDSEGFYGGRLCVECLNEDWRQTHDDVEGEA